VGSAPRSAKRWARSAHLHAVKLPQPAPAPGAAGQSASFGTRTASADGADLVGKHKDTENAPVVDADEVFGTGVPATAPSAIPGGGSWPDDGGPSRVGVEGKARASRFAVRRPLSPLRVSPVSSRPTSREPRSPAESSRLRLEMEVDDDDEEDSTADNDAWVDTDTDMEQGSNGDARMID
jgi:hypothetical protein